jgi:hypothetical protein
MEGPMATKDDTVSILGMTPFEWLKAVAMMVAVAAAFFSLKGTVDIHSIKIEKQDKDFSEHKQDQKDILERIDKKLDRLLLMDRKIK